MYVETQFELCCGVNFVLLAGPCQSCTSPCGMMLAQRAEVACGGDGLPDANVWVEASLRVADLASPVIIRPPNMFTTGNLVGNGRRPCGVDSGVPVSEAVRVGHIPDWPNDNILQETVKSRKQKHYVCCWD